VPGLVLEVDIGLLLTLFVVVVLGDRLFNVNSEGLKIILAALERMSFVSIRDFPGDIVFILIIP